MRQCSRACSNEKDKKTEEGDVNEDISSCVVTAFETEKALSVRPTPA
jgi:hypothetical protein